MTEPVCETSEEAAFEAWHEIHASCCDNCRLNCPHHEHERRAWAAATAHERKRAAKVLENEAERTKHTSHADGLGMDDQAVELALLDAAARIREGL